ncbi:MAG: diguanylate cyclase [Gammaproteobacteria bacterium]|nr:diguanylate cyclase [Gammaproteobacteria bacterium]
MNQVTCHAGHTALVVDDSRAIMSMLCAQLHDKEGVPYESATSLQETRQLLVEKPQRFFVAVLDLNLPDAPDGEVVDLVKQYEIPIIVLTGKLDEVTREQMLQHALVDYVVKRNASEIEYVAGLVKLIQANHLRKVLLVDDSRSFRLYLRNLLMVHRYQLLEAENGRQALQLLRSHPDIQLIITDYIMPEMNGVEFIEQVRQNHGRDELAIIGFSTQDNRRISARLLKAGANDFITKPFEVEEFYCRVSQNVGAISRIREIREAATRDFLTGLCNRRHLFEVGDRYYNNAKRGNITLALAMVDADHFKKINDIHGHEVGDSALKALARILQSSLRDTDLVARFGGEEFVCLAVCADEEAVPDTFERVRKSVEALVLPVDKGRLKLTVSIGVTTQLADSFEGMLAIADQSLYDAKQGGRNRVVYAPSKPSSRA